MKRCPKCNRSFPDDNQKFCTFDGGLLVSAEQVFDPNATIQSATVPRDPEPGSKASDGTQHDWNATLALNEPFDAPTAVLPRNTGPTSAPTSANLRPPPPQPVPAQPAPKSPETPPPPAVAAEPKVAASPAGVATPKVVPSPVMPATPTTSIPVKPKSKLPLILALLAVLLVFGVGAVAAGVYFLVLKPRREARQPEQVVVTKSESENLNTNANSNAEPVKTETEPPAPPFVAPPNTTKFVNSDATLDGKLAEHYFDFSFYYPDNWVADPKAGVPGASNFAKFERRLPDIWQESFAVGWYSSKGTFAADEATFPQLVEQLGAAFAKSFPGYREVSRGPTKVNSLDGYEFRFVSSSPDSASGDLQLWGRVVFLPAGNESANGATLVMLATSRAPELTGAQDIGEKGQMPVILDSFRFGKSE
jgi:hypothetical protein